MGSAVDEKNLTRNLESLQKSGLGGVTVIPIYGVKGRESRFLPYLSPKWMDALAHTTKEAKRLGMGVDMPTGTGWPFGGPDVRVENADAKVVLQTLELEGGKRLDKTLPTDALEAVVAYSADGKTNVNLTGKVNPKGVLDWTAPPGSWQLYVVSRKFSGRKVKRAAPGGQGYAVNPFSSRALREYLAKFDKAFASYQGDPPRAFYHDSYEYSGNWTDGLFEEFEKRRGYDLLTRLPELFGEGDAETVARVKCDYRETMADLIYERFIVPWTEWAHAKGSLARNEAHGSPGNLLDLYAATDLPETEIFGPSGFPIPGLKKDPNFSNEPPDPLMLKFSSSAAHVGGRPLTASESCTWLGEHFQVALSQVKPEIDQLFVAGVNHVFYHGVAYSPEDAPWPGWLFYASTNFAPSNAFQRDFPELNAYIARCQSVLQAGKPDNNILIYWPIYDIWSKKDGMIQNLTVHGIDNWLHPTPFHKTAKILWDRGYAFDYVSDRQLAAAKVSDREILMGDLPYLVVILPECAVIPLRTLENLLDLAKQGATVVVQNRLPRDVPGLANLEERRETLNRMLSSLKFSPLPGSDIRSAPLGEGGILLGADVEEMLALGQIPREAATDRGVEFIRRTHKQGHHYFLTNLSENSLNDWVPLGVPARSVMIFDPLTGTRRIAVHRRAENGATEVYLQMPPGKSLILRTFAGQFLHGPKWRYLEPAAAPRELKGTWRVRFVDGAPKLPDAYETQTLASWANRDDPEAKRFAGTARYTLTFQKPEGSYADWMLDLGEVRESARVILNGGYVGTLWSIPFRTPVGALLKPGENTLEVEVTNLSANRIADLDRRKVPWKKFHDINYVNINYKKFDASAWPPMDSGLLGPVRLVPMDRMRFGE